MVEWRDVRLSEELCAEVERRYAKRFSDVGEILTLVLKELSRQDIDRLDDAEQAIIEKRLKDLGYV